MEMGETAPEAISAQAMEEEKAMWHMVSATG